MKRILAIAFLATLAACPCEEEVPLIPDLCFNSTFDYDDYSYEGVTTTCGDENYERNEDMPQAAAPPSIECHGSRTAYISDPLDVDVFRTGNCKVGLTGLIDDDVDVHANLSEADPNLRFCIFPACADGATELRGCHGNDNKRTDPGSHKDVATVWMSRNAAGFSGCCRIGFGTLDVNFKCPGRHRTVDTYFWLDAGELDLNNATCSKYAFTYNVDF